MNDSVHCVESALRVDRRTGQVAADRSIRRSLAWLRLDLLEGREGTATPDPARSAAAPATRAGDERVGAVPDGAPRVLTDGGQELDEDHLANEGPQASDGDPFEWGPDVENREETPDTCGVSADTPDGRESGGADQLPAATGRGSAEDLPHRHADIPTRIRTMEQRLDRLSDIASDVGLAALNGDLKLNRRERDELETIHEQIQMHAKHVEREVERLTDHLAALEDAFATQDTPALGGQLRAPADRRVPSGPPVPALDGSGGPLRPTVPARTATDSEERPTDADTEMDADAETDADLADPAPEQDVSATVEPAIDQLIPGTELRDMWRVSRRTARNGDGGPTRRSYERWIIETTPSGSERDDDEATAEFPPEVTEFTLDDDEISFEALLELFSNGDSS